MVRITVLASFNMDLVMRAARHPRPGETLQGEFALHLGGKGFNQAVAARRLGAEVSAIGRVGNDEFGRAFLEALDREGIDHTCVRVDATTGTGIASIVVTPDGENAIIQAPQANRNVTIDDLFLGGTHTHEHPYEGYTAPLVVEYADVVLATLETPLDVSRAAADFVARRHDVTNRGLLVLNVAPASALPADFSGYWGVVVANAIEAEAIAGIRVDGVDAALAMAQELRERLGTTVITLGALGAAASGGNSHVAAPPYSMPVVDTTGAGDAFCAALAVRTAEGADLSDAVRFACAAGALACTKHGAEPSMPYRDEVDALVARGVHA